MTRESAKAVTSNKLLAMAGLAIASQGTSEEIGKDILKAWNKYVAYEFGSEVVENNEQEEMLKAYEAIKQTSLQIHKDKGGSLIVTNSPG